MFIQRKITSYLSGGEQERQFDALLGLAELHDDVKHLNEINPQYTCLCPRLHGVDPDDVFSLIPYEKGFNLLFYLEKILGGPRVFEPYVKKHVEEFSHKSITTDDFKDFLYDYFGKYDGGSKLKILESVDWEAWFHKPGMPPVDITYDRVLADKCQHLADQWLSPDTSAITPEVYNSMFTNQRVMFLDRLVQKAPLPLEILAKMDQVYSLTANNNAEVKFKWQSLCLASGQTDIFPHVVKFITSAGRMKYVRPLYRALHSLPGTEGKALAKKTFLDNRDFYHPICEAMVAKDLGL